MTDEIFVFGSNLRGVHGAGAALYAKENHGAEMGVGVGPTGTAYALPTKDRKIETLPLEEVRDHVGDFLHYALTHPEKKFRVTAIGCGLAGFTAEQIAPMFSLPPENVRLPPEWREHLGILDDTWFWSYEEFPA